MSQTLGSKNPRKKTKHNAKPSSIPEFQPANIPHSSSHQDLMGSNEKAAADLDAGGSVTLLGLSSDMAYRGPRHQLANTVDSTDCHDSSVPLRMRQFDHRKRFSADTASMGSPAAAAGDASGSFRMDVCSTEGSRTQQQQQQQVVNREHHSRRFEIGSLWGLVILALAYVHHSTTGFALPALLPAITRDFELTDSQGALLTAGYTMLYAVALVPVGLLADRVDRPRLLAMGLVMWSLLTVAAAHTHTFGELFTTRIGFAIAQATQNPICFSLIPELFPQNRTAAMAFYNAAIYMGRALSFAVAILAERFGVLKQDVERLVVMVPLDKVDLSHVSILYTQGDMAAITPIYDYRINLHNQVMAAASANEGWRHWLQWLGPPGLLIAALCLLTVDEPRAERGFLGDPLHSSKFTNATTRRFSRSQSDTFTVDHGAISPKKAAASSLNPGDTFRKLHKLLASRAFQSITFAATLNDVGSWALISWHATFYERVYGLPPETYGPLLAVVVPVGGLRGGVGGGLMGDWLSRIGGRQWLTAGACLGAAPLVALSILAPDYKTSFAALLVGFALAEAWRAPAAIMVRDVSPVGLGSTAASVHLCLRNIIGGLGPLCVAVLADRFDLRSGMLLIPFCFLLSGMGFLVAEQILRTTTVESSSQRQLPPI